MSIILMFLFLLQGMDSIQEPFALEFKLLIEQVEKGLIKDDLTKLSFEKILEPLHKKQVVVKGFIIKDMDGVTKIASQPSLKSCCLGNHEKVALFIALKGKDDLKQGALITVQGKFQIDPQFDNQGQLTQLYVLNDVKVIEEKLGFPWLGLFLLSIVIMGLVYIQKRKLRYLNP